MSDRELKKALQAAFPAPEPVQKRAFVRSLPPVPVSYLRFLLGQAGYIRKSAWAASLAVFALALAVGRLAPKDAVWATAALTPFAAVVLVTEGRRPVLYGMEELERTARYAPKCAMMSHMCALGFAHFFMLVLLVPLSPVSLGRTGVYLLTPYLLTTLFGSFLLRTVGAQLGAWAAGAAAVLVAGLSVALHIGLNAYAQANFRWWPPVLLMAALLTAREVHNTFQRMEELTWN